MLGRRAYDAMYRWWAPWDAVGVRAELRALLASDEVDPRRHPRALDLGCGTGANVVFLAEQGFHATGVDFSAVALDKARRRAAASSAGHRCRFVEADLTSLEIAGLEGSFDLLIDFGSIDDLTPEGRTAAARLAARVSHGGSRFLFWCFRAARGELPVVSFHGPSKLAPGIEPGEELALFGADFEIEPFCETGLPHTACFLLTRRGSAPCPTQGDRS